MGSTGSSSMDDVLHLLGNSRKNCDEVDSFDGGNFATLAILATPPALAARDVGFCSSLSTILTLTASSNDFSDDEAGSTMLIS